MIYIFLIWVIAVGLNAQEKITSKLEVFDIYKNSRKVIYEKDIHFEAPNWSKNGKYLIFNRFWEPPKNTKVEHGRFCLYVEHFFSFHVFFEKLPFQF